jgi:hypothetical protein
MSNPTCDTPGYRCRYAARPSNQEPCRGCDGETCWTPEDTPQPRRLARKADSEMADYLTSGRATEAEMELYVYRRNGKGNG